MRRAQTFIGAGCLVLAVVMAAGAAQVHGEAGYAGVGPAFLPWVVSGAFLVFGVLLIAQDLRGRATATAPAPSEHRADWRAMAWVCAGLLLNAVLIEHVGFVMSCALLFVVAARGFRLSMGLDAGVGRSARDAGVGLALSAPVYWMFTKGLGLTLPGLTANGWI